MNKIFLLALFSVAILALPLPPHLLHGSVTGASSSARVKAILGDTTETVNISSGTYYLTISKDSDSNDGNIYVYLGYGSHWALIDIVSYTPGKNESLDLSGSGKSFCGNGTCESSESPTSCSLDCQAYGGSRAPSSSPSPQESQAEQQAEQTIKRAIQIKNELGPKLNDLPSEIRQEIESAIQGQTNKPVPKDITIREIPVAPKPVDTIVPTVTRSVSRSSHRSVRSARPTHLTVKKYVVTYENETKTFSRIEARPPESPDQMSVIQVPKSAAQTVADIAEMAPGAIIIESDPVLGWNDPNTTPYVVVESDVKPDEVTGAIVELEETTTQPQQPSSEQKPKQQVMPEPKQQPQQPTQEQKPKSTNTVLLIAILGVLTLIVGYYVYTTQTKPKNKHIKHKKHTK